VHKLIDISFHYNEAMTEPETVINRYKESNEYLYYLNKWLVVRSVKHINYIGTYTNNEVLYRFYKGRNKFFYISFNTLKYIKDEKPDFVLIQGLCFPIQLLITKLILPRSCKVLVQHHVELPFTGIRRFFQKIMDRYVDAYLFTALGNAENWVKAGIIRDEKKCFEVLEASTYLKQQNKEISKKALGLTGENNFLWVARLNNEKDPLTVLSAFAKHIEVELTARLYMIFQTNDLLEEVVSKVANHILLAKYVTLVGRVAHEDLVTWYSASDYYISGSHKESTGYALLEAMACGCIPVVTDIPSFKKITANGQYGFLYKIGDVKDLVKVLALLQNVDKKMLSEKVVEYFNSQLRFENIAVSIYDVCSILKTE